MQILVDAQLPPALARFLCDQGHEASHVIDLGMEAATDDQIWHYAIKNELIIMTKDEDFPHRYHQNSLSAPTIIWLRIGNVSRRALLVWITPLLVELEKLVKAGERLIEVR
ncbi:MAG: DUF5615 family PIN-like protein [Verrucomicrobiales bacterium]